jgi:alanyl-tRNA synthetase
VGPDRLRFDFTHPESLTVTELDEVEARVNRLILADQSVSTARSRYREAVESGVIALFEEKYGDVVRVVNIGEEGCPYSRELCGGIHCRSTGEIGLFLVVGESSIGAGLRRIESVTGRAAVELARTSWRRLRESASQLNCSPEEVAIRIDALQAELRERSRELDDMRRQQARRQFESLRRHVYDVRGVPVLAAAVPAPDRETLRAMADWFRGTATSGVAVLAAIIEGRPALLTTVTEDLARQGLHADWLVREVAGMVGGSGGGRTTLAEGGGGDPEKLREAIANVTNIVKGTLT